VNGHNHKIIKKNIVKAMIIGTKKHHHLFKTLTTKILMFCKKKQFAYTTHPTSDSTDI
jgi:hypothetical protein